LSNISCYFSCLAKTNFGAPKQVARLACNAVHSVKSVRGKQWKFCVAAQQDIEKAWSRDELEEKN
jgi:hypothetical protein